MKNIRIANLTLAALALLITPFLVEGKEPLLIAVASNDKEATSLVSEFAARCPYYLLFDETLQMVQVVNNPFLPLGRRGAPQVVDYLAQKGVGAIVAGRFGPYMIEAMNRRNMKYFQFSGIAQEAVERVVNFLHPPKKGEKKGTQPPNLPSAFPKIGEWL
jgi:predicted Fe-Mo cluster-binding NifX family protein